MTDSGQPRAKRFGVPKQVVLYPDPRRGTWRHAIQGDDGGVIDGFLDDVPADAPPRQAQAAVTQMLDRLGRGFHLATFTVDWTPADRPGWWTGHITATSLDP